MEPESQVGVANKKGKAKYFVWTADMDRILSATLVEQLNMGHRLDGKLAWKQVAWTASVIALRDQLGIHVTKQNIQSRLKTWHKHYGIISEMLSKSGFSWDYTKNMIHVSEEGVWNTWVKEHPEVAPYRKKISLENWDDICVIFAQDCATGEGAQTAVEVDCEMTTNESNNLEETLGTFGSREALDDNDDATNIPAVQRGRSNASSSSSQRKRHRNSDGLHTILARMADSLERFLYSDSAKVTTEMVLQEVSKVPDLNRRQLLRVVDLMMHDVKNFEIFSGLPNDLKKEWIMMHLGQ